MIPNYLGSIRYKPSSIVPRMEVYSADKPSAYTDRDVSSRFFRET